MSTWRTTWRSGSRPRRSPRPRSRGGSRSCSSVVRLADFATRKPGAALRRPAAARRAGAGAGQLPERAAARRAARRARPQAPPGDAARAQAHPARGRHHVHLRDPRSGRGAHDERPDRGHERGPRRADRHAPRRSTTSPHRCSSPGSSGWPTCYLPSSSPRPDGARWRASGTDPRCRGPPSRGSQPGDPATFMIRPERMHVRVDEPTAGSPPPRSADLVFQGPLIRFELRAADGSALVAHVGPDERAADAAARRRGPRRVGDRRRSVAAPYRASAAFARPDRRPMNRAEPGKAVP